MRELLTFDDVLIVPRFSTVQSRKDVDMSLNRVGYPHVSLPVISANMDTITNTQMSQTLINYGAQACLHRFSTIDENVRVFEESCVETKANIESPMVSVGLGSAELSRAEALFNAGATFFVIDVAHGAQLSVVEQAKNLRELIGFNGSITVGNFATGDSVKTFLEHFPSVDGFKVGVGPGSACTTRIKTGIGVPQLSAVLDIAATLQRTGIIVIADGGLRTPGDIAKALGAGANLVMLGGMLAGTAEAPGELINDDGRFYKKYRGSASKESYEAQGKNGSYITAEGESFLVPYKGSVVDILRDIEGGIRSSMTYVGAKDLNEFRANCDFVRITSAGVKENGSHGKIF